MKLKRENQQGTMLIYLIIFIAVFAIVMPAVVGNFVAKMRMLKSTIIREQALQIAEAGINYYQWHLVQFPADYKDGTEADGPYVHDYVDYDTQQAIGQFSLVITAPPAGETAVTIQSTGWTNENPAVKRTVTATYGIPSLASYALLAHDWIYAWSTESYSGPVHSDTGIRFEGTTESSITSSVESTYLADCQQQHPENPSCTTQVSKDAIWALGSNKSQSFPYWSNPTTKADFTGISSSFSTISGQSSLPANINLPSSAPGYSLVFNDNGTVTVYKVISTTNTGARFPVTTALSNGSNTSLRYLVGGTDYNTGICTSKCSSCHSGRCFQYTKTIPSAGLVIYAANNLWVEGTVKGRVIIATANGSADVMNMAAIYISNNLRYSDRTLADSQRTDVIGLLAEGNIIVTKNAPDPLYIDGALLSQNGFVAFPICYSGGAKKNHVYFFGSIILHGSWWFNFTNYCGNYFTDGYLYPHFTWDKNLLYRPPPYFPASSVSADLQLVKWESD
jgi:hypothetical protein